MEAIEFKLKSKMAHFRKYYSNSSALSYYIPPVTTIKGIIAGLLGYERDTYYNTFSNENCHIAIALDSKIRKITQTMNLMKITAVNELCGSGVHSQNNTEWIIPENIREGEISYTIIFSHNNPEIMDRLYECVASDSDSYRSKGISVALGSAQCLGWISEGKRIDIRENVDSEIIDTRYAINVDCIKNVIPKSGRFALMKEETITEFDENRLITANSKKNILLSGNGEKISYQLKNCLSWSHDNEDIVFLV